MRVNKSIAAYLCSLLPLFCAIITLHITIYNFVVEIYFSMNKPNNHLT